MRPRIFGTRKDWQLAEKFVAGRREFLMAGGSLAILPLASQIAPGAVRSRTAWASDPFTLGVASGEPSSSGMVLWTRLLIDPVNIGGNPKGPIEVVWELSDDPSMKTILKSGKVLTTEALGHSVHVQVHGLESNRCYWYRFHSGDASSPIGRTRTTPGSEQTVDELRFAFASCQHYESGLFTAYEHMVSEELDLILHLGDYIYEGAPGRSS
jgi:alkaline phosphatase D